MSRKTLGKRAFLRSEFIGQNVMVDPAPSTGNISIVGNVADETMGTFRIVTDSSVKIIPKSGNIFQINGRRIDGRTIMFRPEDRIKKIR